MRSSRLGAMLLVLASGFLTHAHAQPPTQVSPVTLERQTATEAALRIKAAGGEVVLSLADLEALPLYRVTTSTFWPADDGTYEGPLLADVLQRAGLAEAAALKAVARDGFSQVIPRDDWTRWPVMIATRRNGQPMTARTKGPLRIIYPRDMDKTLHDTVYRLRWVWLLQTLEVSP